MTYKKFMRGSSTLIGDGTVPGVPMPKEVQQHAPTILRACREWGLDFYDTVIHMFNYDEISEIAAYGGFPVRYPHWSFGQEYESLQIGYTYGFSKIYELVINSKPCNIYNLASNSLLDHLLVIAHATGHNDFFKNNIHFSATDTNMLNKMANHGTRIRKYMARWGHERVTEFIDHVLRLQTLVDGSQAWREKVVQDRVFSDTRKYYQPRRLTVDKDRMYMEPFINTKEFRDKERERIAKKEIVDELELFQEPTKDILGFLKDNAPMKPWQADIMSMLYEEALYFYPQRQTKIINEGWASLTDHVIMAEKGYASLGQKSHDCGIVEYAEHKAGVLGGKYSTNPYKLGFELFLDIRDRWNKGRFGNEWEDCKNIHQKENWDTQANLGDQKVFEVRKYYDDVTLIHEFFTEDFCRQQEYFHWKHYPNGEYKIEDRDYKKIKKTLIQSKVNGGLPVIKLTEPNYQGKGYMMLQHDFDGRQLHEPYLLEVMTSLRKIWGRDIFLSTFDKNNQEVIYQCIGTNPEHDIEIYNRKEHIEHMESE